MRFIFLLAIYFSSLQVFAKTNCVVFIGDGNFMKPQLEDRFIRDIKAIKKSWSDCGKTNTLVSIGKNAYLYDQKKNAYSKIDPSLVDGIASKENLLKSLNDNIQSLKKGDTLKLFVGDHGSPNGASTSSGVIGSTELRTLMEKAKSKGLKVQAVFDHCYSGNMLDSLYDTKSGAVYGCGISSANDKVAYDNPDFFSKNTIQNKSHLSQNFGGANAKLNQLMATSDRFLFDYAKAHSPRLNPASCNDQDVYMQLGVNAQNFLAIAAKLSEEFSFNDLKHDITQFAGEMASADSKIKYTSDELNGLDKKGYDHALQTYFAFQNYSRKTYINFLNTVPETNAVLKRKDLLYQNLVKCGDDKKIASVMECPGFKDYSEMDRLLNKFFEDWKSVKKVSSLGLKLPASEQQMTVKQLEEKYRVVVNKNRILDQYFEKKNLFNVKKLALMQMIKNKDLKSIKAYREMRACEKNTVL